MTALTKDDIDRRLDEVKHAVREETDDLTKIIVTAFSDITRRLDDMRERVKELDTSIKKLELAFDVRD
jgi:archaellum component FlaC